MFSFHPFPTLATQRLLLRQPGTADHEQIFNLRSNASVNQFIRRNPTNTVADAAAFVSFINNSIAENKLVFWAITPVADTATVMGTVCLWKLEPAKAKAELGYEMLPQFQRQGIMQEAVTAVLDYGRNAMRLVKVEAFTNKHNIPSLQLLRKNGFIHDTRAENELEDKGELEYNTIYSRLY